MVIQSQEEWKEGEEGREEEEEGERGGEEEATFYFRGKASPLVFPFLKKQ